MKLNISLWKTQWFAGLLYVLKEVGCEMCNSCKIDQDNFALNK